MSTDQYRPCWIELDEESEKEETKDNDIDAEDDDGKNNDKCDKFYGKYDSDQTPTDEKLKLEKLYWESKLKDE